MHSIPPSAPFNEPFLPSFFLFLFIVFPFPPFPFLLFLRIPKFFIDHPVIHAGRITRISRQRAQPKRSVRAMSESAHGSVNNLLLFWSATGLGRFLDNV